MEDGRVLRTEEAAVLGRTLRVVDEVEVVLQVLRPDALEDELVVVARRGRGAVTRLLQDPVLRQVRDRRVEGDLGLCEQRSVGGAGGDVKRSETGRDDTLVVGPGKLYEQSIMHRIRRRKLTMSSGRCSDRCW
jgi:hypothetical protein